jgi:hypothetical protein
MIKMTKNKLVEIKDEFNLIKKIGDALITDGYDSSNSTIITISTEQSSIMGQLLRHQLSLDGEVTNGFSIDVPVIEEEWDDKCIEVLNNVFQSKYKLIQNKKIILVRAQIKTGVSFEYVYNFMKKNLGANNKIISVTLFENISSNWESDYVGEYYDAEFEKLSFWWENSF